METGGQSDLLRGPGRSAQEIDHLIAEYSADDPPILERMSAGSPFPAGADIDAVALRAATAFWDSNAMYARYYPSLMRMESELIEAGVELLHGDANTWGTLSSGGSESILLALKSARDYARAERGVTEPELVIATTGHPAFWKAAAFLGVRLVPVDIDAEDRPDLSQFARSLNEATVMAVASAPNFTLGTMEPVTEMAAVARAAGVPLHVDGCVGGFFLPFLEQEGYPVPRFDFRIEGVETISADLHKYGYAPRGISMLLTRRPERLQHQYFTFGFPPPRPKVWYRTPGVAGSRPGASIAAAWAVMAYLGREGYGRLVRTCRQYCERMWETINGIDGLFVNGQPLMPLFTYSADERTLSLAAVTNGMEERGWLVHKDVFPRPLVRLMQSPAHAPFVEKYLSDLAEVAELARHGGIAGKGTDAAYT